MPSLNSMASAGRFQISQCTQVPRGASGSSQTSAKVRVSTGAPVQRSGGDRSSPSQVCRIGTVSPSRNEGLVSSNPAVGESSRGADMVSASNLEPEPRGGAYEEYGEHPLERRRRQQVGEPGAAPSTEEETDPQEQGGFDVEIPVLVIGICAENADRQQQRAQGGAKGQLEVELRHDDERGHDEHASPDAEQPRQDARCNTDQHVQEHHGAALRR